jgi:hypothetical protein
MARIGETVSESKCWPVKIKQFDCEIMGIVLHDKVIVSTVSHTTTVH